jgi:hypothetical protein
MAQAIEDQGGNMSRFTFPLLCSAAFLVSVAAAPLTSRASSIVYSNLNSNPSDVYNCCNASVEISPPLSETLAAMSFTPGANYDLNQIDLAIQYFLGTNGFTLNLVNDHNGLPGSTVIESWAVTSLPGGGTCCILDSVTSTGVLLEGGAQYWLEVLPFSDSFLAWNLNNTGALGTNALSRDNGKTWSPFDYYTGAFDVLGNPVPEPSAAMLLGTALVAMLVLFHFGSRRSG